MRRIAAVAVAGAILFAGCGDIHAPSAAEKACVYEYSGKRLLAENPSIGKTVEAAWARIGKHEQAQVIALCLKHGG